MKNFILLFALLIIPSHVISSESCSLPKGELSSRGNTSSMEYDTRLVIVPNTQCDSVMVYSGIELREKETIISPYNKDCKMGVNSITSLISCKVIPVVESESAMKSTLGSAAYSPIPDCITIKFVFDSEELVRSFCQFNGGNTINESVIGSPFVGEN